MKKLIKNIGRGSVAACILFCLPTVSLFAQFAEVSLSPCSTKSGYYSEPTCNAAKSAFRSASVIVTGNVWEAKIESWISVASWSPVWGPKIREGLKFSEAVDYLKQHLAGNNGIMENGAADRAMTIDNAFREVYGRKSTPLEQATGEVEIKAQKAWYATIVFAELKKLKSDPGLCYQVIQKAYTDAMGRMPTLADANYWKPRKEHYRILIDACRNWLYSAAGVKDLTETVTRALREKYGNPRPSNDDIKKALIKYNSKQAIYSEM